MNRKGFTLIELLAVLVILGIIAVLAIPSINSSMSRTREKQNAKRIELILSSSRRYVSEHKNQISKLFKERGVDSCYIEIDDLVNGNYLSDDLSLNMKNKKFDGLILYVKNEYDNGDFSYIEKKDKDANIIDCDGG